MEELAIAAGVLAGFFGFASLCTWAFGSNRIWKRLFITSVVMATFFFLFGPTPS